MKTQKTLRISFPTSMACTLFLWDGNTRDHQVVGKTLTELSVRVQRRTERRDMASKARLIYGATTQTLIG